MMCILLYCSVKYGVPSLDHLHVDSFFELQRTRSAAESDGWELVEDRLKDDGYAIFCKNKDFRVCELFDSKGSVAGVQIAVRIMGKKARRRGRNIASKSMRFMVSGDCG